MHRILYIVSIKASSTITLSLHIRITIKYGWSNWAHLRTIIDRLYSLSPDLLSMKYQEYYVMNVQKFLVVRQNIPNKTNKIVIRHFLRLNNLDTRKSTENKHLFLMKR